MLLKAILQQNERENLFREIVPNQSHHAPTTGATDDEILDALFNSPQWVVWMESVSPFIIETIDRMVVRLEAKKKTATGKDELSWIYEAMSKVRYLEAGLYAMKTITHHLTGNETGKLSCLISTNEAATAAKLAHSLIKEMDVVISAINRKAVGGAHKENREMKAEAIDWYRAHRAEFKNKDDAAEYMTRLWKVSFATIRRNWINGI